MIINTKKYLQLLIIVAIYSLFFCEKEESVIKVIGIELNDTTIRNLLGWTQVVNFK